MSEEPQQNQLEKILQANARNILKKLKEGKTLTKSQLSSLAEQLGPKQESEWKGDVLKRSLSLNEMASVVSLTERRVQQLKEEKLISDKGEGVYEISQVTDYIKYLRGTADNRRPVPQEGDLDRNQMAARKDAAHAEKLEMENDVRRGELVVEEEVGARWVNICSNIRASLMSLPSRLAKELSAMDGPREIQIRIDEEVRLTLESLADQYDS